MNSHSLNYNLNYFNLMNPKLPINEFLKTASLLDTKISHHHRLFSPHPYICSLTRRLNVNMLTLLCFCAHFDFTDIFKTLLSLVTALSECEQLLLGVLIKFVALII